MAEYNMPNRDPFGLPLTASHDDDVYESDNGDNDVICGDITSIQDQNVYSEDTRAALSVVLDNVPLEEHMPSYLEELLESLPPKDLLLDDDDDVPLSSNTKTLYSDEIVKLEEESRIPTMNNNNETSSGHGPQQKEMTTTDTTEVVVVQNEREEEGKMENNNTASSSQQQQTDYSLLKIEDEDVVAGTIKEKGILNSFSLLNFGKPPLQVPTTLPKFGKLPMKIPTTLSNFGKRSLKVPTTLPNAGKLPLQVPSWNSNSTPGRVEILQGVLHNLPTQTIDHMKENVVSWLVNKRRQYDEKKEKKSSPLDDDEELERNGIINHSNTNDDKDDDDSNDSISCSVSSMTSNTILFGERHLERLHTLIQKPLTRTMKFVKKKREKKRVVIIASSIAVILLIILVTAIAAGANNNNKNHRGITPSDIPNGKNPDEKILDDEMNETYEERMMKIIRSRNPTTVFDSWSLSPPSRAMKWMLEQQQNLTLVEVEEMDDKRFIQRFALVTFWYSTHGEDWDHRGWLEEDTHECDWDDINDISGKDVHCDENNTVTRLELDFDGLTGSIPDEIALLTSLSKLSLHDNGLEGTIPSAITNLSGLSELLLQNNALSGTIPAELSTVTNLFWLRLENNQLSGTIPTEFGNLEDLSWLLLQNNTLTGTVPYQLSRLSNLSWMALNHNKLSGSLPNELGALKNIFRLLLHENYNLGGSIAPSLCSIPRVTIQVDLENVGCSCCTCCD